MTTYFLRIRSSASRMRKRILAALLTVVLTALGLVLSPPVHATQSALHGPKSPDCQIIRVPVTLSGASNATMYGELCTPRGEVPDTVQLLVPGSTNTHVYYDFPSKSDRYSYVKSAADAGYATFNIDRIGSGESTRPLSSRITLEAGAETLHQVIAALRSGDVGSEPFSKVVWVGHSLGSIYAWVEAAKYQDIDAFVLTGMTHRVKPSFVPVVGDAYYPASQDPKFADSGYDAGYLTTKPEARPGQFFYQPGAEQRVIDRDEKLKNTVSGTELNEAVALITSPPPETAPSQAIRVPTVLVVGDKDPFFCGAPDGIMCSKKGIVESEQAYYHPDAQLDAIVANNSGHSVQLHRSSPSSTEQILDWINRSL